MKNTSMLTYPEIQRAASKNSKTYQKANNLLIMLNLVVLVLAAGVEAFNQGFLNGYYPKTTLLLLSLFLASLAKYLDLSKKWYASRSLSESIKTLIWRFKMKATPFEINGLDLLVERLEEARLESNIIFGSNKFSLNRHDPAFKLLRDDKMSPSENLDYYIKNRINHQLRWYKTKAQHKKLMANLFFILFATCISTAVICSILQELSSDFKLPMTGLLIAISTALIGWIESNKYNELFAAYLLTEHEIKLLLSNVHTLTSHEELSKFVSEAESLFSREHTQWAVKRGHSRYTQYS